MAKEKIEVGDIRPIYQQVEAELLADAFKRQKKK